MDDALIERAAEAAHEVNRTYSRLVLGDSSHLGWRDVPLRHRRYIVDGVKAIVEDPAITCAGLHERWMRRRLDDGWMYGPRKDHNLKIHPCLVPYHQLPLAERVKDTLFGVVVRAVLGLEHNVAVDAAVENIRGGQLGQ